MSILTAIDLVGIQDYVFGSNRLRDVIGASELVNRAVKEAVEEKRGRGRRISGAGGNAVLEFPDREEARGFAARYSRWLVDEVPGLEALIVHEKDESAGAFAPRLEALLESLEKAKRQRRPHAPLLGLGVTASCRETGLPATGFEPGRPLSSSVLQRRQALGASGEKRESAADRRWREYLPAELIKLKFPIDNDDLGRSHGETSLIGVVHVDGNGIGAKFRELLQGGRLTQEQYTATSRALDELVRSAMAAVIARVASEIEPKNDGFVLPKSDPERAFELRGCLPVRPVLVGGDDLTFLCDGRLAMDLAAVAVHAFERALVEDLGPLTACAGVAIVKSHAPFARAYALAESLCARAKGMLREDRWDDRSALDWHVGLTLPGEPLEEMRKRQYQAGDRRLTCRPYLLSRDRDPFGWDWLSQDLLGTGEKGLRGSQWRERRSKIHDLRELVRDGPKAVNKAMNVWKVTGLELALPDLIPDGFRGSATPLLDAIELLDLYIPLGRER